MFNPYDIAAAAGELALNLADYLRRQLLPSAPATTPVATPYTPPFVGGQCDTTYSFDLTFLIVSTGQRSSVVAGSIVAPISDISAFNNRNGTAGIDITGKNGKATYSFGSNTFYRDYTITNIRRSDGLPDNCGNLPNPNPSLPVAGDGLASSPPPNIENDDTLVLGSPLVVVPSIGAALSAIAAAVAAAANALDAVKKVMDAIEAIGDVLDKIKDWLDDKDKEDDTKKSLYVHNYGSIRKDGFLRLYPNGEVSGFKPMYIDLQLLSIPIGYGKYFGNLSPNFYRFKSLGHISFVSASFGVLETHELEFSRTSITVPENAFGFFYHLGLEDAIRANVSLFYLKNVE